MKKIYILVFSIIFAFSNFNISIAKGLENDIEELLKKNSELEEQISYSISKISLFNKKVEEINYKIQEQNQIINVQTEFLKTILDKWNDETAVTKKVQKDKESLFNHVKNIDTTILLLSIIITLVTAFILIGTPFFVYYLEQKRDKDNKEKMEWFEQNTKDIGKKSDIVNQRVENIYSEIGKQFSLGDTLSRHMENLFKNKMEIFEIDYKSYKELLVNSLDDSIKPIEERKISAENIRYEIFQNLKIDFEKYMETNNNSGMKTIITFFFEFNYTIESILSDANSIKYDGLARLVEKVNKDQMPDNMWELIKLLKKQNRLNDIQVIPMLKRAAKKFDWPYEELRDI